MVSTAGLTGSYVRRGLVYCVVAVVASSIGSMWTWTTNDWFNANPLSAGLQPALFSLGPAIAIVAIARIAGSAAFAVASSLAVSIIVMWGLVASSDSSTSGLIFLWGWFVGVPVAVGIVAAERHRNPGTVAHRGASD